MMIHRTTGEMQLDELVFENRNQSYGAYELRQVYNTHIRNSLLLAVFFSALLSGGLYLLNNKGYEVGVAVPPLVEPGLQLIDVILEPKSKVVQTSTPVQPPVENILKTQTNNQGQSYIVKSDPIEAITVPQPIDATNNGQESTKSALPTNTTGAVNGSVEGNISVPIESKTETAIFYAEVMPTYEGGMSAILKYLADNTHYPNMMVNEGISGRVIVSFVVGKDGRIFDVAIVKGVHPDLDAEAMRVIWQMPTKWTAGKHNGQNVAVRMTVPIVFSLH